MTTDGEVGGTLAARCHEIQVGLGLREVPDFDTLPLIGMSVRLALHIQGLGRVDYQRLRLVTNHLLQIPLQALPPVLELLEKVGFVRLVTEGKTIKAVIDVVPYYEDLYSGLSAAGQADGFNEMEQLTIEMLTRLSRTPYNIDSLRSSLNADAKAYTRAIQIGSEGSYLVTRRARGRDILLSPTYFTENADVFADLVASKGPNVISSVIDLLKKAQGMPLALILKRRELAGSKLSEDQIEVLKRLAMDGAVKPPAIETSYAGENYFIFTPTPSSAALSPTKREMYERAMAIVAAVRQGQFLPANYAIRDPEALLWSLKTNLRLKRATTEFPEQYKKLVHAKVGRIVPAGGGFYRFEIIDTAINREALDIAYDLVKVGGSEGVEVDDDARSALVAEQDYVDSLLGSARLRSRQKASLSPEAQLSLDLFITGG